MSTHEQQLDLSFEQSEHLERVTSRIGAAIIAFFTERRDPRFHAEELRRFIRTHVGEVAPGSPDRVMRALRQSKRIDYEVVSRRDSEYLILHREEL